MTLRLFKTALCSLALLLVLQLEASAQQLSHPTGRVILTVTGNLAVTNREGEAAFDRDMLQGLGVQTMRTSTTWTDGTKTFEGVLVRELLGRVGARGEVVAATALNDYSIEIPRSDFEQYDVLLAFRMDGKDLLARDKGPLWIVYPRDQRPELRDERYDSRWVWQLKSLRVR